VLNEAVRTAGATSFGQSNLWRDWERIGAGRRALGNEAYQAGRNCSGHSGKGSYSAMN